MVGVQFAITTWTLGDVSGDGVSELLPESVSLCLDNTDNGHDGDGEDAECGNGPAQEDAPPGVGVGVVGGSLIVIESEHPDDQDQDWRHKLPAEFEDDVGLVTCHVLNVGGESVHPIEPDNGHRFKQGDVHKGDGSGVVVKDLEEVNATLKQVGKATEKRHDADSKDNEFMSDLFSGDDVFKSILDAGDDHFNHGKLTVNAQTDQHGKEDDSPQLW